MADDNLISERGPHFTSDNHALLAGRVLGRLLELPALSGGVYSVPVPIVDEGGNYTNQIEIRNTSGQRWLLTITEEEVESAPDDPTPTV